MGKFSGVLLASDYDGTLADGRGEIGAFVREKIAYFIREGGFFTVCTGRSKQGFHAFDPALMNAPVLLANGMQAFDYNSGQTVFADVMEQTDLAPVAEALRRFPEIGAECYTPDFRTFVYRADERSRRHLEGQRIVYASVPDFSAAPAPFVKLMLSAGRETGRAVQRFFDTLPMGRLKYNPTDGEMVELLRADSGKGAGLLRLAASLGVEPSRVFAVGDGDNDLELLSAAAAGFAPENACEAAKAAAKYAVPSHDEGAVGHVVDRLARLL